MTLKTHTSEKQKTVNIGEYELLDNQIDRLSEDLEKCLPHQKVGLFVVHYPGYGTEMW